MRSFLLYAAITGWAIVIVQNFKILRNLIELIADKVRR